MLCFMVVLCCKQKDENAICILNYDLTESCTPEFHMQRAHYNQLIKSQKIMNDKFF